MDTADVALVRWPDERGSLDALRSRGEPRLIVVEHGSPPAGDDCLEDWLRAPVDVDELRIRVEALRARARHHDSRPTLDEHGVLRYRGRMATLPPVQRELALPLLERWGTVVSRELLERRAWPDGGVRHRNVLDVHMTRLRRALLDIGIETITVRRRGYLLRDRERTTAE